jgi:glutathione peroxidase
MKIRMKVIGIGLLVLSLLTISCAYNGSSASEETAESTETNTTKTKAMESIYDIKVSKLDGSPINLSDYKGKKMLFVNVASKCGYTPQYAELQELYDKYKGKLEIFGVPCNQFGSQEPGSSDEIAQFCEKNYGVTFTMLEKADVKGASQHPLYAWLTMKEKNGLMDATVKWNFHKFLVGEDGELINMFNSRVNPMGSELVDAINK